MPTPNEMRKLLFISYAYKDQFFAKWLARKLAFYGYGVWIDQLKILGGESWVEEVDVAIKDRSFRVLGILSRDSIDKPNPRKERTLALQLGNGRGIKDFLITLNLDDTSPDWTLSDISWLSFKDSWTEGLRRLLRKLAAVDTPQIHAANRGIAISTLERGWDLVGQEPERLVTNWIPFETVAENISIYDSQIEDRKHLGTWPSYSVGYGKIAALSRPPPDLAERVQLTREIYHWPSCDEIRATPVQNIIAQILNRTVRIWLLKAGCLFNPETKSYYLPSPFRNEAIYRFCDADGSQSYVRTAGRIRIRKLAGPPEEVIHHPSIRFGCRRTAVGNYVIQITPGVALFDVGHEPITGSKIGPRRKKVTRGWYNEKWRKRFLAFAQLLREEASKDQSSGVVLGDLLYLAVNKSLIEARLATNADEVSEEVAEQDVAIGLDELAEWKE